jgi:hypothetical protein
MYLFMAQMNVNVTEQFARDLKAFMKARGLKQKSAALRVAMREAVERMGRPGRTPSFTVWVGLGNQAPKNRSRRFRNEDELWEKG